LANASITTLRGTLISFTDDPFLVDPFRAFLYVPDGLVVCRDGMIESVGAYDSLRSTLPRDTPITDYSGCIITPGFIDTHVHYVQSEIIAAPSKQLLQWVSDYIYPVEEAFADETHARAPRSSATRSCATARPRRASIGAGTSFSLLATLNEAYKVAALVSDPITALEGLYLVTLGGARALDLDDRIGSLAPGREADLVVLEPNATKLLAFRNARSKSIEETLFVLMTLGDDRTVRATYVAGHLAHAREPVDA
jgi:cytosine/adenosine deaminase-related metal-dependent hydrolase